MKFITTLILATAITASAEVKVTVGDISDKRTTGKFFSGMDIELKLSGPELAECKGLRVTVKDAKDDAGKAIKVQENRFNEGGFESPQKAFGGFNSGDKKDELQSKVELENPARTAKSITLEGTVELIIPSKDPAAVVTVDVAKEAGKPLANEALKAAGVNLTFQAVKDGQGQYTITDPKKRVAFVEYCSADGKPLETSGGMSSGFNGKKDVTVNLNKAGAGTVAKVFLVTDKSILSVPVKLSGVTLP